MAPLWTALPGQPGLHRHGPELPSPFDELGPSPVARRAAQILQAELRDGALADVPPPSAFEAPGGGKMFGVLVVETFGGGLGFLRAFSGTIDGRFDVLGFVPPIFDGDARFAVEETGERVVTRLTEEARALADTPEIATVRAAVAELATRHADELREMRQKHAANRHHRRQQREQLERRAAESGDSQVASSQVASSQAASSQAASSQAAGSQAAGLQAAGLRAAGSQPAQFHDLDQQSRRDKAERRVLDASQTAQSEALAERLDRFERRAAAHARLHRMVSRRLMQQIHDTYRVSNARGEVRSLRDLYASSEPPGGAGDCAAPKLLSYAYAHGLRPLALAEFWWGAPPPGGGRVSGAFYPACREKCGPLLPFMLEGLDVAEPRGFTAPDSVELDLPVLFEDDWIVVVDKPCGLLSVPSRSGVPDDSVLARLRRRDEGVLLVHRLDLDTSGVMVAARDPDTHAALQRQFLKRTVEKRYIAIVERNLAAVSGRIVLALRVDVHDRPRQIVDPAHGRSAVTEWQAEGRRITFFPRTGRTHQLRVHAAHPLGLNAAIVGDRLYGHAGDRLMLHAESLAFIHPQTGERVVFESPAPF